MGFNIAYIRSSNKKAQNRYIRYGTKLFLDALKAQAVENPDPKIMENAYVKFYMDVFPDAAKRGYYQVRESDRTKDFSIDSFFTSVWREWIREWVKTNLAQLITEVNNTTRNIINEVLQTAIEDGLNPFQTQKLLQKIVGNRARALAIATTESTRANNMGQERSADDYQAVTGRKLYKVFIHSGNPSEPRRSHIFAQGKPIPKEEPFNIEGVLLMSPGNPVPGQDRKMVARQVIKCKCTVAYIGERVARQRYPEAFEGIPSFL